MYGTSITRHIFMTSLISRKSGRYIAEREFMRHQMVYERPEERVSLHLICTENTFEALI